VALALPLTAARPVGAANTLGFIAPPAPGAAEFVSPATDDAAVAAAGFDDVLLPTPPHPARDNAPNAASMARIGSAL